MSVDYFKFFRFLVAQKIMFPIKFQVTTMTAVIMWYCCSTNKHNLICRQTKDSSYDVLFAVEMDDLGREAGVIKTPAPASSH